MVTEDISGLTAGYYKVTVTDQNGCMITDSVRVNLPPPLNYQKTVSDYNGYQISCNGMSNGYVSIEPLTGEPPLFTHGPVRMALRQPQTKYQDLKRENTY